LAGPAPGLGLLAAADTSAEPAVGLFCSHHAAPEATATPTSANARYGFLKDIKVSEQNPKQF
jgi:hypothetical protein